MHNPEKNRCTDGLYNQNLERCTDWIKSSNKNIQTYNQSFNYREMHRSYNSVFNYRNPRLLLNKQATYKISDYCKTNAADPQKSHILATKNLKLLNLKINPSTHLQITIRRMKQTRSKAKKKKIHISSR